MKRFDEASGPALSSEEKMRATLLHLIPIVECAIDAVEIQHPFAMLDAFPALAAEQVDVIFETERGKVLSHQ